MTDDATSGPDETAAAPPAPAAPAPGPGAFAPVLREPWINPAKRRTAALVAAVIAVALFGSGLLIGALATGGHGRHDRWQLRGFDQYPDGMHARMRGPMGPWAAPGHGHAYGHGRWAVPGSYPPVGGRPSVTSVPGTPLPSSSHR